MSGVSKLPENEVPQSIILTEHPKDPYWFENFMLPNPSQNQALPTSWFQDPSGQLDMRSSRNADFSFPGYGPVL
jgi:hypothetical protein